METIIGNKVILRRQILENADFFAYWFNQPDIMFQCGFSEKTTLEKEQKALLNRINDQSRDWYTITDKQGKIIGETGLLRIWNAWHCSDLTIIIPNKEDQGKGYGKEAIHLLLDKAFTHHNLNRVAIGVVEKNINALKFYEKIGFKKEGIQEQGYYYNGEYMDFVMMRILKEEWLKR
ncbi:GNAT family protein [Erysipelotrichaceae bacterium HCN-30851]